MEFVPYLFILLVPSLLLGVPILIVVLWLRVRRLERERDPAAGGAAPAAQRFEAWERRLAAVERQVAGLAAAPRTVVPSELSREEAPSRPSPPEPPPAEPVPAAAPAAGTPAAPARPAPSRLDLEALIAGRWLNRVGIVALLLAVTFFLKYAFDNDWIGPAGRVAIGLLAGAALLAWSPYLLRRGYRYFSEGIAGLGAGVLYLSLYAAWAFYQLLPQVGAFVGMMAVTAGMTALAVGRGSQRLALVALAGGYATPLLVGTGTDQQTILFTYLLVLNGAMLALSRIRDWKILEWLAFLSTLGYFSGWYARFYDAPDLLQTALWATAFFVQFAAFPVLRARIPGRLSGWRGASRTALVLVNLFWYLAALHTMLWPERRWTLTLAVLLLAVAHLAVARAAPEPPVGEPGRTLSVRLLFAGLALTLATLAIPIRLEGEWITIALALEGAVLAATGLAHRSLPLRGAGLFLFAVTAMRLLVTDMAVERFLLNARFATFFVAVSCFGFALLRARAHRDALGREESRLFATVGIAANAFLLWVLSMEIWDALGRRAVEGAADTQLAQQLGLSLLWVVYATVLTVAGFRGDHAGLRWQGLALFGLVVGKVFLYDLSFLDRFYRIASFVVLGAVLLGVSFFYQRRQVERRAEERPGGGA